MPKAPSAVEVPIKDIFSSNYLFNIPGYQRPYAWTTQQAGEMFEDLWGFLQQNPEPNPTNQQAVEEAPTYFLGSIVLIKEKDRAEATVVDGQQRLTTLTILLSALRDRVPAQAAEAIGEYIYEKGNIISQLPDRFRLKLRQLDADFFQLYIQKQGGLSKLLDIDSSAAELDTDAKKNIRTNAQTLVSKVAELTPEQAQSLAICIANRCYIVAVSTADFQSAFRIFSVMNSRGLDLGPTDILKARLLENVAEYAQARSDAITNTWEDMEVDLGRDGFLELFTHIRAILKKAKAKESLLEELTQELKSIRAVDFFDNTLVPAKAAFTEIRDADYSHSTCGDKVNADLGWLNRVEFKDWVPPAMAFWMKHRQDGALMARFIADLERLTYGLLVLRESDTTRIARFGEVTREIERSEDTFSEKSRLQLSAAERGRILAVLDGPFYTELRSPVSRKAVLLRLDSLLASAEATYDHPIISVEHVLPQTVAPGSTWEQWFSELEEREYWTHRLANLVLLAKSINSSARNFDFERKKKSYFVRKGVTTFALTVPVLGYPEWTASVLKGRQETLVAALKAHWRLG